MFMYSLHGRLPLGKRIVWPHTTLQMAEEIAQWEVPRQGDEAPLLSAASRVLQKSPFPKPRSHFSSLTLQPFHTSNGCLVQVGSTKGPTNLSS